MVEENFEFYPSEMAQNTLKFSLQWFLKFKRLAKLDTSSVFWEFLRNWGN